MYTLFQAFPLRIVLIFDFTLTALLLPQVRPVGGGTEFCYRTVCAIRLACVADGAAVKDNAVAKQRPAPVFFFGDNGHQVEFEFDRVAVFGQAQAAAESNHVRVADDTLYTKAIAQNDIGGLSADTVKGEQLVHRLRDDAAESFENGRTGFLDAFGFVAVKAGRADVVFKLFLRDFEPVFGAAVFFEQVLGDDVDAGVSALGGQDRGNQQFQRRGKIQRYLCVGIGLSQNREEF